LRADAVKHIDSMMRKCPDNMVVMKIETTIARHMR
jgi:hypothetical protein